MMISGKMKRILFFLIIALFFEGINGQTQLPMGIPYQAVARDNFGKELASRQINVRFSILSETPVGPLVYQELHSAVTTSKFGVFSLIIGKGLKSGGSAADFSKIEWSQASHFLKVEVKFENDYIDMGTMQFLAVPYALYAQKSLEPGPQGQRGEQGLQGNPGNPATDDQTLSFDGSMLSISGGNSLTLNDLIQNLTVINQADGTYLGISRANSVKLATIESDGDPKNEIQDLTINADKLKITNNALATEWDLTRYLDNTDAQSLTWDPAARTLGISGNVATINLTELKNDPDADPTNELQDLTWDVTNRIIGITGRAGVNLSELKNDADASPTNEIQDLQLAGNNLSITGKTGAAVINLGTYLDNTDNQTLTYTESTNSLTIDRGNTISLGSLVAFRAKKTTSEIMPNFLTDYDFITGAPEFNDGGGFNYLTGLFTAPSSGIYTFNVNYVASGTADSRILKIFLNGSFYETLNTGITGGSTISRQLTMKLSAGNTVKVIVNVGTGYDSGTGSFSGYKVF